MRKSSAKEIQPQNGGRQDVRNSGCDVLSSIVTISQYEQRDEHNKTSSISAAATAKSEETVDNPRHLQGWRLRNLTMGLGLAMFLCYFDITATAASMLSIGNELRAFSGSSLIISSYLVPASLLPSVSKCSSIYGPRPTIAVCLTVFIVFSPGAARSRGLVELCAFQVLRGVGAAGTMAMALSIIPNMVTKEHFAKYSTIISSFLGLGNVLGPICAGCLNMHGAWRLIYWTSVPVGTASLLLVWNALPPDYPNHTRRQAPKENSSSSIKDLDFIGSGLALTATVLTVSLLEIGKVRVFPDPTKLLLASSTIVWLLFVMWQRHHRAVKAESFLPWTILTDRFQMAPLVNVFFVGASFTVLLTSLPIRSQLVFEQTTVQSGFGLLALMVSVPLGSVVAGILMQGLKQPPLFVVAASWTLQVLAITTHMTLFAKRTSVVGGSDSACVALAGLGLGMGLNASNTTIPVVYHPERLTLAIALVGQARALGGALGVAAAGNIMCNVLEGETFVDIRLTELLGCSRTDLTGTKEVGRLAYQKAFEAQEHLAMLLSAASIFAVLLLLEGKPRRMR